MKCPVCRAENDQGPQCRRCRADLSLLYQLQEQRRRLREQALNSLKGGNLNDALRLTQKVAALGRDDDSQKLLAVVQMMRGNFAEAFRVYRSLSPTARNGSTPEPAPRS